jgi:peptidyl-prolyl cis-trans isomerase D
VIVRSSDQDFDTEVADDDVQSWYDSHLDDYHRDDGLRVRYVVVDRADLMTQIEITDEELRQHYEENQANYTRPEMREARHILFRVDPNASDEEKQEIRQNAETTRQRVLAGEDFAELARVLSEDEVSGARGGDLGMFPRERMVPPFSEAAFNTAVGELAPVTETQFGFHVIEVTGEQTAGTTPLEEVTQSLRQTLTVQRAQERVADEARRLRDAITTPDVFDEIADREGLIIESAFVTGDDRLVALGASPDFVPTLFDIGPGSVSEPLNVRSGLAIVAVDVEVPAGVAPIDEIRNEIATDVLNDRARARALESARTSLDAGGEFSELAERLGSELQESGDLSPNQDLPGTGGLTAEVRSVLFGEDVQEGDRGAVAVPSGALVYEVTYREGFDRVDFETRRVELTEELRQQRRQELELSMVEQLREDGEVQINDTAIRRYDI